MKADDWQLTFYPNMNGQTVMRIDRGNNAKIFRIHNFLNTLDKLPNDF